MHKNRYIVHADMDAFFAAIEQRDHPEFCSKPVIVGADPKGGKGRGVVSTCSYEARRYGVHSAMPISEAYRRCPHAVYLPVDMEKYGSVSSEIFGVFYSFTPDIEPVGIDEAFLDITGSHHLFGTPLETCMMMKKKIRQSLGLTVSCGLAPTKMAAKIASDLEKPDGMVVVDADGLSDFLRPLGVRKIWGLGAKGEAMLNRAGIMTIGDLAGRRVGEIADILGNNGIELWKLANGIDDRVVESVSEAKSVSNEITFDKDTLDRDKVCASLMALCEKVSSRMRHEHIKCRTVTLKIRLEGFHTFTRGSTMDGATNFDEIIYKEVRDLYDKFDAQGKRIRLVGVKASGLTSRRSQADLFSAPGEEKREMTHAAIDKIKERFGDEAIYKAGGRETGS